MNIGILPRFLYLQKVQDTLEASSEEDLRMNVVSRNGSLNLPVYVFPRQEERDSIKDSTDNSSSNGITKNPAPSSSWSNQNPLHLCELEGT